MTALQALRLYRGDLTGKTVFVPAGCSISFPTSFVDFSDINLVSGTGLFACQLAKHVFRASKVITTVSTAKIPKLKELLGEGTIDEGNTLLLYSSLLFVLSNLSSSYRLHEIRPQRCYRTWNSGLSLRYSRPRHGVLVSDATKIESYNIRLNVAFR